MCVCVCEMIYMQFRGVMAYVVNCDIEAIKFKLQLCYLFHFRTNTIGKGMNPLIPPVIGQIVLLLSLFKDDFDIK